jgi:hypothetical protein
MNDDLDPMPTTTSKRRLLAGEQWTVISGEDEQWWADFYDDLSPEMRIKALDILRRFVQGPGL